jgi:hypothetical protein
VKWKRKVTIVKGNCYSIQYENSIFQVPAEDEYIIQAMEDGITKDEDFISLVMGEEQTDGVDAGLRMAEFVIKYGEYLENPDECKIIPW